jgi:hypothetical protein
MLLYMLVAAPTICVLALGRAWILFGSRKKLEARKLFENSAESHPSAARFVGTLFV